LSYIGQRPVVGRYIKLDQISSGFNGSNTGFSMTAGSQAVFPGTARNLLLSLGGVIQEPDTDFTISGSTLTFTTPPVANTTFFGVIYGDMQATGTPSDGTVLPASIASSGNFSFPEVTVTGDVNIADSIIHSGDSDTKIRFPGSDLITMERSGAEVFRLDSSGLKIPDKLIHTGDTDTFLEFGTDAISLDTGGVERLKIDGTEVVVNDTGASVDFRVEGDTDANLLFVDAGEDKVGIGTGTPSGARLHVVGSGNTGIKVQVGSSSADQIYLGNTGGASSVGTLTNVGFNLIQNGGAALAIDTSKRVGIGTTSPSRKLHVVSSDYQTARFESTADNADGSYIEMNANSSSPADNDILGLLSFRGNNSAAENLAYASIRGIATDVTDSTEDGDISFHTRLSGTFGERIRINSSGNVGIGTTSPLKKLHIADAGDVAIMLQTTNAVDDKEIWEIGCAGNASNHADLIFRTRVNAGTGGDEAFRLTNSGNVGIGTSNPPQLLSLSSPDPRILMTETTNNSNCILDYAAGGVLEISVDDNDVDSNSKFQVRIDGATAKLTLDSTGLGIGTTSPSSVLHVDTGLTGAPLVTFHQTNGGSSADAGLEVETSSTGTYIQRWINSGDEKMRVTGNGLVGIGTISPAVVLDVHVAAGGVALQTTDATNSTFQISHPSSGIVLLGSGNGQHIAFGSNFTEQIRMDSSGRLLIGTESSLSFNGVGQNHNLIVAGSTTDTNILNNSGAALTISNTDGTANNTAGLHFAREDTDGAPHYNGASIVAQFKETMNTGHYPKAQLAFLTSSANNNAPTEKYRITSMGSLTTAQSSQSVIGRDWTSGSVAAGTTINWNGSGADAADSKLNFNSIGGNGGGHLTCLSVSSQDQQPSGAMIITGVHGAGFNSYVTHASNFDSGITVTFNGTVTIQNTSSETIYYAVNVIHLGTGNTTYLGR